jgi:multiple sugar transport system substrate-binding protein
MKKKALLSAFAVLSMAVTTGCSAGVGSSAGKFDPALVKGSFDWKRYSGSSINVMLDGHPWTTGLKTRVGEFTKLTGIKVNVQSYTEDLYFDKMAQAARSSSAPDVYMLPEDDFVASQFAANLVEPLSPYLNNAALTNANYGFSDFPDGLVAPARLPAGSPDAQVYEVPISTEAYILFYNKDLVNKYLGGVVPTTMKELIADAKTITAAGAGKVFGSVERGVRSDTARDTLTGFVLNQWPKDRKIEAPYNVWFNGAWDKPILTDPNIIQGVSDYAALLKQGPSNKFNIDWPDATSLFSQGKVAFFVDASVFGPGFENASSSAVAGKVGYARMPKGEVDGSTGVWSWALALAKHANNKGAAWLFTQWATGKEMTAYLGSFTGGAPRQSSASDPAYSKKLNPEYVSVVKNAMSDARTTAVIRDGWKAGVYVIVDGMLAITKGGDPMTTMTQANDQMKLTIK